MQSPGPRPPDVMTIPPNRSIIAPMKNKLVMPTPTRGLAALLLVIGVIQAVQVVQTLTRPPALTAVLSLNPALEVVAGGLWAAALLLTGLRLLRFQRQVTDSRRIRAFRAGVVLLALFTGYAGGRIALFAQADYDRQRAPLLLVLSLSVMVLLLAVARQSGRRASVDLVDRADR